MKFSEIKGYRELKNNLIRSVQNNHLAHALMFNTNEGGAGLSMTLAFATYINCENKTDSDSCGECPSCHKMSKLIHPDLHFFIPVTTTAEVKKANSESFISQWREFLNQNPYGTWYEWSKHIGAENKQLSIAKEESIRILNISSMKPFEAGNKIIIIWLPEFLNHFSANALLKNLEEPPQNTIFLLITEDMEKILPTIISRTQITRIPNYNVEEVSEILEEKYNLDKAKSESISQIVQGNVNEAIKLSSELEKSRHEEVRKWLLDCHKKDMPSILNKGEEFQKWGRESQKAFIRLTLSLLRESLAHSSGNNEIVNVGANQRDFIQKFSKTAGWEKISIISGHLDKAHYHLERNLNPKIVFLDCSLLISSIFQK